MVDRVQFAQVVSNLVHNSVEAIAAATLQKLTWKMRQALDIVVSDYRLPGYNGVEVVQRVRRDTLPAVIMTGDTSTIEIEVAGLSYCTVLHKPVNTDRLISLIEELTT